MRPLAVLIALVFGSSTAISFGLLGSAAVFWIVGAEELHLAQEFPKLLKSCGLFVALSGVSGSCLYSTLRQLRWAPACQVAMWLAFAGVVWAYWPK